MPFGRDDRQSLRRISEQLGSFTADLAAVKQRLTDQQRAVDRIRHDDVSSSVAAIGQELVAIKDAIARLDDRLLAVSAPATGPGAGAETAPDGEPAAVVTLRAAAGISAAALHAHRDTWEFLVKHAGADPHFHVPGVVAETCGMVVAHLSGPSLVAVLTSLDLVRRDPAAGLGTQAIAHHLHERIGGIVRRIAEDPRSGCAADPVVIRVDDRPAPEEDEGGQR